MVQLAVKTNKGIYIESKDSTWYNTNRKVDLPELMLQNLCRLGFCQINKERPIEVTPPVNPIPCPIYLQSFLYDDLLLWKNAGMTAFTPTVALSYDGPTGKSPYGDIQIRVNETSRADSTLKMEAVSVSFDQLKSLGVSSIGLDKNLVLKKPEIVAELHAANLVVHVWTLRNENSETEWQNSVGSFRITNVVRNIDSKFEGDIYQELKYFTDLKVDGIFTDYPGTVRNFLDTQKLETNKPNESKPSPAVRFSPFLTFLCLFLYVYISA